MKIRKEDFSIFAILFFCLMSVSLLDSPAQILKNPLSGFLISVSYAESSAGIGIILQYLPEHQSTRIRAIFKGSPASKAHIRPGDEILSIDGVSTRTLNFEEVGKRILGNPGTSVVLVLRSSSSQNIREVKLIRTNQQKFSPLIVGSSSFKKPLLNETERNQLKEIVRNLKTPEEHKKMEKLMIDFRDGKISKERFLKKIKLEF